MKALFVLGLTLAARWDGTRCQTAAHPATVTLTNGQRTNLVGEGRDMMPLPPSELSRELQAATAAPAVTTTAQTFDMDALAARGRAALDEVRKGTGSKSYPLETYVDGNTQLSVRVKDGGGELHKNWADFLICIDGEGTEMTGGTMVEPTENAGGEVHGKTLEGAVAHPLHKGVMIHIPAGTNHQQIVAPGKYLTILVIKVKEPNP